jgi:hypothetical protein
MSRIVATPTAMTTSPPVTLKAAGAIRSAWAAPATNSAMTTVPSAAITCSG